ncbi:MAG: IS110 family transposase [Chloroflexi bacterium]|nr:IS110 family transposase [Chloroflexota bacterium]
MDTRRKGKAEQAPSSAELPKINPNAAGLDIGASDIWVAIPPGRDGETVRVFGTFTPDLCALADWLKQCQIDTVAMESTGVYWIPIYNLLEARGLQVYLVNPLHLKRVPGRKSDLKDCQWIQQLHSYGLLSASFRPSDEIRVLRTLVRQRAGLIDDRAMSIQHRHKAFQQMNLQLGLVVSDITGVTGMRIVRAIVAGERDPLKLARYRDRRCTRSEETIAKALSGDYRAELIFVLKQSLALDDVYTLHIAACDTEIAQQLAALPPAVDPNEPAPTLSSKPNSHSKTAPGPEPPLALYTLAGVDLLASPGFSASTAQTLLSEIGTDLSAWPNEKAFCSWLGLAPHHDISGGKVLRTRTLPTANRAGLALRLAAQSASRGQSASAAFYRRLKGRIGTRQAIVATAHKLGRIVYGMLKERRPYTDIGAEAYTRKQQDREIHPLRRRAEALGFALTPPPASPAAAGGG